MRSGDPDSSLQRISRRVNEGTGGEAGGREGSGSYRLKKKKVKVERRTKHIKRKAAELAQQVRVLSALPDGLELGPSTYTGWPITATGGCEFQRLHPLLASIGPCTHLIYIHTCI